MVVVLFVLARYVSIVLVEASCSHSPRVHLTRSNTNLTHSSQGFQDCPNSSIYCYKPSDPIYGIESCSADTPSSSSGSSSGSSGTSSQTDETETSSAPASGASGAGATGGSAGTEDTESSASTTRSGGSSSATDGSDSGSNSDSGSGSGSGSNSGQGSAGSGNSNGSPVQNSSGHSVVREGLVGVLFAGGVAFVAALHLRV
jgi:cobalamin biosynthesis Mg chelatase CobN